MKKNFVIVVFLLFTYIGLTARNVKYCSESYKGKYEISLIDDGTFKASFNLYENTTGRLLKSLKGKWTIRDEGVYGTVYRLTFEFTGVDSNLPSMKFTCQYDGYGQLQAIIDSQDRTWDKCR
jgi:YD repeat-containing protein